MHVVQRHVVLISNAGKCRKRETLFRDYANRKIE